jgi:predicted TIM-barrel fold metal-dependent hydrolase
LEPPAAELERAVGELGFVGTLTAGRFLGTAYL